MHRWAVRRTAPERWSVFDPAEREVAWSRDWATALDYADRKARARGAVVRLDAWLLDAS